MATNIRQAFTTDQTDLGFGPFYDTVTSTTIRDIRIRGIYCYASSSGGAFPTGVYTIESSGSNPSALTLPVSTSIDSARIMVPDFGFKMRGKPRLDFSVTKFISKLRIGLFYD